MLIDLHTHTFPSSDDSFMDPDDLVRAAKASGLDGICITEHDTFWDPRDILALSRRHNYLVLPGCEVNTDGGHVLVFGLESYVFGMHRVEFLRRLVDEAGGVMVAAHPHRRRFLQGGGDGPDSLRSQVNAASKDPFFSYCDAIEALNGRASEGETEFCRHLGRALSMRMVGGSDSHRATGLGGAATRFRSVINGLDDLVRELRAGRFEPAVPEQGAALTPEPIHARRPRGDG